MGCSLLLCLFGKAGRGGLACLAECPAFKKQLRRLAPDEIFSRRCDGDDNPGLTERRDGSLRPDGNGAVFCKDGSFLRLRELGLDVDTSVFTVEQAKEAFLRMKKEGCRHA